MNVLAFAPEVPYPADHGQRLRTWHLLTRLVRLGERVTLVTWPRSGVPAPAAREATDAARTAFTDVVLGERAGAPLDRVTRAVRQARFVAGGLPPYAQQLLEERGLAGRDTTTALAREIDERHRRDPFDVVVCEEEALRWCPAPPGVPVVVHRLNVFSQVLADQRRAEGGPARAAWLVEAAAWRRFDRQASAGAHLTVATTAETAAALDALVPHTKSIVVPNGVTMRRLTMSPAEGRDLAFIGWMGYPPNIDAVCWFARDVWPRVHTRFPESKLRIVGRNPAPEVFALARDISGVVVTGEVADVAEACEGIRAGIAPLRAGMGIKNKTLELMSMGVPVVASPAGAEGIGAGPYDGLLVAHSDVDHAAALVELLGDGHRAAALGAAARTFVANHFAWEPIAADYHEALLAITRGAGNRLPA